MEEGGGCSLESRVMEKVEVEGMVARRSGGGGGLRTGAS